MIHKACLILGCILICLTAPLCLRADVELNGYTFPADSADLFRNPFYNAVSDRPDLGMVLNAYGDFQRDVNNYNINQWFNYTFNVAGIECSVMFEEGYYPVYNPGTSSFDMEYYQGYLYLASDTEDNVHILQLAINLLPNEDTDWDWTWDYTDLSQVKTTLLYPSAPTVGQEVFGGHVEKTDALVKGYEGCMIITFDALPQYPSRTVTYYVAPGIGVIAAAYNWEGGSNGFSRSGDAPDQVEEHKGTWEKLTDDYCFISACSP